jgi:hypothetical protein
MFFDAREFKRETPSCKNILSQFLESKLLKNYHFTMVFQEYHPRSSTHSTRANIKEKHEVNRKGSTVKIDLRQNEIFSIPSIDDLTEAEKKASWYQKDEFQLIKANIREVAHWVREKGNPPGKMARKKVCLRGLERLVYKSASKQRKKIQWVAATAVFLEQDLQQDEGTFNSDFIAEEYSRNTLQCQTIALRVGILDARAAVHSLREDPEDLTHMSIKNPEVFVRLAAQA